MAWNEPGGKRRDPWQGGGEKPPDFDAVLRRVRDRFGGSGSLGVAQSRAGVLLPGRPAWSMPAAQYMPATMSLS